MQKLVGLFSLAAFVAVSSSSLGRTIVFRNDVNQADITVQTGRGLSPLRVELSLPRVDLREDGEGDSAVLVPGLVPSREEGRPELPESGVLFAVPRGYAAKLGQVIVDEKVVDDVLVRPARKMLRCGGERFESAFDQAVYSQKDAFPENWTKISKVGEWGGLQIFRLQVSAVRYEPAFQRLKVAANLSAEIELVGSGTPEAVTLSPSMRNVLNSVVTNAAQIAPYIRESRGPELLLVIVADSLKGAIQPWIDWKNERGYQTKVVTASEAGTTKEKIKTWIQTFYNASKPTYLLMVGNEKTLPAYTEETDNGPAISDYRYTLLAGGDALPDILYGRLAADNENDVKIQIRRWIDYEKAPRLDNAYSMGTTIASSDTNAGHPYDNEYTAMIQKALKAHTYQSFDDFWQKTGNATPTNIKTSLERGRSWLTYIGHGSGTSWGSTNGYYEVSHIKQLAPASVLPIIIDVACLNGSWAELATSFGEAWVKQVSGGADAGAVAYFGASQSTNWHEPAVMSVGAAEMHVAKKIEGLGATVSAGLLQLLAKMGNKSNVISNFQWYNLLGDPTLLVRTMAPKNFKVSVSGNGVTVSDESGMGVANLAVTITNSSKQLVSTTRTDSSGKAAVTTGTGGTLTVSGYNYVTQQTALRNTLARAEK